MARKVAVLAPMITELRPVVWTFDLSPAPTPGDPERHTGRSGTREVIATLTGIGTRLAEATAERVLNVERVDYVVVVGIAGGVGSSVRVFDVLVPDVVVDASNGAEYCPALLDGVPRRGRLVSSDDFHVAADVLASLAADGVVALDMETAAVAAVCERHGCEWSVVRAISDMADGHPIGEAVMGLARPDGRPDALGLLKFAATHLGKVPELVQLGRDSRRAADLAARHAARACARLG
jgi:adenosylhomocysteine nucleosidase